jgi:hypothetical protein
LRFYNRAKILFPPIRRQLLLFSASMVLVVSTLSIYLHVFLLCK